MLRVLALLECSLGLFLPTYVSRISECMQTVGRASLVGGVSWLRAGGSLLANWGTCGQQRGGPACAIPSPITLKVSHGSPGTERLPRPAGERAASMWLPSPAVSSFFPAPCVKGQNETMPFSC